jgi:microsomal dipeptidase-like Zn-dependent dipeptidase
MPIKYCKSKGEQVEVQYFQPDGVSETKFNPWSINLYDEDIKEILDSDGIIGLILDERVLGTKQKKEKDLVEYFSKEEFCNPKFRNCVFRHNGDSKEEEELSDYEKEMHKLEDELREHLESIVKDKNTDLIQLCKKDRLTRKLERIKRRSMRKRKHILKKDFDIQHLCNNILHIVHVGGDKAWKHICLGTDFDGLINPIEGCNYASNFDDLRKELKIYLPKMALEYPLNLRITGIDKKVDDFMYWNAWRFLQKNFN